LFFTCQRVAAQTTTRWNYPHFSKLNNNKFGKVYEQTIKHTTSANSSEAKAINKIKNQLSSIKTNQSNLSTTTVENLTF